MIDRTTALKIAAENQGSVFLESVAGPGGERDSFLFSDPEQVFSIDSTSKVATLLQAVDHAVETGHYIAGFLGYECGYGLDPFHKDQQYQQPIAWLGAYKAAIPVKPEVVAGEKSPAFEISNLQLSPAYSEYQKALAVIHQLIAAGETYQINYTGHYNFDFAGDRTAFYTDLLQRQPVKYAAFINTELSTILSLSPELFFRRDGAKMTARPMKGTAPRGRFPAEDREIADWLTRDEKSRAENVMIVDLLRNDLSRICLPGTVQVPLLFQAERYRSLFQMTSTIVGQLKPQMRYHDIFQALFPCGSVTGAPKIRSMEIIRQLEKAPRGVYTGAIGYISPHTTAVFNVPIRTIVLEKKSGTMGSGGGIVWDSDTEAEYRECQLKAQFLTAVVPAFQLLETFLWQNGFPFLEQHLHRMGMSADYFDYPFDPEQAREVLWQKAATLDPALRYRFRLLLSARGSFTCQVIELPVKTTEQTSNVQLVALARRPTDSSDRFLYHKTTHRGRYDSATQTAGQLGFGDILFVNENGLLTEGAISNVFVEQKGVLLTPAIKCGVLPGIYRQHLLETREDIVEAQISKSDLENAEAIYISNAVRGLQRVRLSDQLIDV